MKLSFEDILKDLMVNDVRRKLDSKSDWIRAARSARKEENLRRYNEAKNRSKI